MAYLVEYLGNNEKVGDLTRDIGHLRKLYINGLTRP